MWWLGRALTVFELEKQCCRKTICTAQYDTVTVNIISEMLIDLVRPDLLDPTGRGVFEAAADVYMLFICVLVRLTFCSARSAGFIMCVRW